MSKIKVLDTTMQEFPNFVIFKINKSKINIDVLFEDETLWLTQKKDSRTFRDNTTKYHLSSKKYLQRARTFRAYNL